MQYNAANVYATMQKDGLNGRALEAQVLTRAANMLQDCMNRWGEEGQESRLDAAISFNQKVWTFFQAELSDTENPLPAAIKESILSLSIFIDRRLIEITAIPQPDKLTAIININQNIAAGLMERPKTVTITNGSPVPEHGKMTFSA